MLLFSSYGLWKKIQIMIIYHFIQLFSIWLLCLFHWCLCVMRPICLFCSIFQSNLFMILKEWKLKKWEEVKWWRKRKRCLLKCKNSKRSWKIKLKRYRKWRKWDYLKIEMLDLPEWMKMGYQIRNNPHQKVLETRLKKMH